MKKKFLPLIAAVVVAGVLLWALSGNNNQTKTPKTDVKASETKQENTQATNPETTNTTNESTDSGVVYEGSDDNSTTAPARVASAVTTKPASVTTPVMPTTPGMGGGSTTPVDPVVPTQPTDPAVPPVVAPSVTIVTPVANTTVAGSITLTANTAGSEAVAGVQYKVDGANSGAEVAASPYTATLDTTTLANGSHTITAVVRTVSNKTATSAPVTVTVNNTVVTPPTPTPTTNLISNPSVEESTNGQPNGWTSSIWGANAGAFTYATPGRTGNRALQIDMTARTDGDAKWGTTAIPVTPGKTYQFSDFYKSNVITEVDVEFVIAGSATTAFQYVGQVNPSADWTQFKGQFTAPAGATSVVIYHILAGVGTLTTDDYSLELYTPVSFTNAMVSLTFDDGWKNIHEYGLPLLKQYGLVSTQYLNSDPIVDAYPDYMTPQDVLDFLTAGHEIASHTKSHTDLTTLTVAQMDTELSVVKDYLQSITGQAPTNFASPFGAFNPTVIAEVKKYYASHRSVQTGYNSKDNFDIYNIKVQNIVSNTTPTQIKQWVDEAIASKTWLVLVYHEVAPTTPPDAVGLAPEDQYWTTPADLEAALSYIKGTGVEVRTVQSALTALLPQL